MVTGRSLLLAHACAAAALINRRSPIVTGHVGFDAPPRALPRLRVGATNPASQSSGAGDRYFVDGAVRNAALQRGIAPLTDAVEMGALVENLAAASLNVLAAHSGTRLHYWRDRQYEVDLGLDHPTVGRQAESALASRLGFR